MTTEAPDIFSKRLRQARAMKGLALRGLADAIGGAVSHTALAKYEAGQMQPDSTVLIKLCDALDQVPDYFFRPFTITLQDVRFRKKASLGVKAEQVVRERAMEYFERYYEIEQIVDAPSKFPGRLAGPSIKTPEAAEKMADELRKEWKLGRDPLPNVIELIESHGIKVFELANADQDFDGFSAETEAGPVIVLADWLNVNLLRKRMTAVHELAHLVLPLAKNLSEKEEEDIVKRFAGALLLPKESFEQTFGKHRTSLSLGELIEMKANFGASIWAIMMRARQLGLIGEQVFLRFCREANAWRAQKHEPGDDLYRGNESHSRFKQLVHRAVAEECISASKASSLLGQTIGEFRKEFREVFS
jgi:Zn-dependent peptidase ImmA (M78 family)/DNA-binding XRE family transcriptional regulator